MSNKINTSWPIEKLGNIAQYLNGKAFKKSEWSKVGRPIIRIQNLTGTSSKYNYYEGKAESRYEVEEGDLLISWSATIGAYIYKGEDAVLNQHIFKVVPEKVQKKYLYYFINYINTLMYSQAHGTGMTHITKGKFEEIKIPLPGRKVQKQIVDKIEELFSIIDNANEQIAKILGVNNSNVSKILMLKQSILKKAFDGKLV